MANISDYLSRLQELTQQNMQLLKTINEAFYTNQEHLTMNIGTTSYTIPSFISLENKINALQESFSNLINIPKTGEARFNIDGNSRAIELKGYTCTPERVTLDPQTILGFSVEQNDIFKDFMTPNPYLHLNLQSIPNDITEVNVKKVAMRLDTLKDMMRSKLLSSDNGIARIDWSELYKILSIYREDQDYVMYDTRRNLPVRKNIGTGVYTIKSVIEDNIDPNTFSEYITVSVHEPLKYKLFDETVDKFITIGDQLVTYDGSAKFEVEEINPTARKMKLRVMNGDYVNLSSDDDVNAGISSDSSKLKFFSPIDFDSDKYIDVPLEEDQYVCIFVAPLDSHMNIQAPWGGGIVVDVDAIKWVEDKSVSFREYYNNNVRNVGDTLAEMTAAMTSAITKYGEDDFLRFTNYVPSIDTNKLKVLRINGHLNNSETIKNIRALHSQKQEYNRQLEEVQMKIDDINTTLAERSFSDVAGARETFETQLTQYSNRRNELINNIMKVVDEISLSANNSTVPLEAPKYRIRGYYQWYPSKSISSTTNNTSNFDDVLNRYWEHVRGIKVQYRYKNQDSESGSAVSIDDHFVFSDWNEMPTNMVSKIPSYSDGYKFGYRQYDDQSNNGNRTSHDNGRLNEPSFNQIDIPISQGESVDIRLKIVWDFGAPFVESTSEWSEVVNIKFPDEFLKDVSVLDIIEENNKDIETNRFKNILTECGLSGHIEDEFKDQDAVFHHKATAISSGFYTEERRVIPLFDKLLELNNELVNLKDIVEGTNANKFSVEVVVDGVNQPAFPDTDNQIILTPYSSTKEASAEEDSDSAFSNKVHSTIATIVLTNTTDHVAYLYSMFPCRSSIYLNQLTTSKYNTADYCGGGNDSVENMTCVPLCWPGKDSTGAEVTLCGPQTANQWVTFRMNDAYTAEPFYGTFTESIEPLSSGLNICVPSQMDLARYQLYNKNQAINGMMIYPYIANQDYLKIHGDNVYNKLTVNPKEAVQIPIMISYRYDNQSQTSTKKLSFDIRTSLYDQPTNYLLTFTSANNDTIEEKVARAERNRYVNNSILVADETTYDK